ncbi:MAG TPA: translocation protein TolB [Verrucomicrobiae bacterium]|nr:translocation protein TolB [Verrucomicrobiae bacterium]
MNWPRPARTTRVKGEPEAMVHLSRCICVSAFTFCLLLLAGRAAAQEKGDWFHISTGLGVEKPRVAVTDFAPQADTAKSHSQLFTQVVRDDLQFSGVLDLISPSFYPTQVPTVPSELRNPDWITPQINANLVAFGNLTESAGEVVISGWAYDVRSPSTQAVVGKIYRGTPTDAQVRKFAHQFADEIISRLSGGLPGIASTQIAFVSSRTGTKEIWLMDYDGANQHPLTSLRTISLTPRWSPDASRIAFTCFVPGPTGVVSPQICMYSMDSNKVVSFPRFRGSSSAPAWSPDGSQIMFSSSMLGNPELFVTDASGGRPKRITFATGASTSPTWNPKTGQSVVFVSDRGGIPKLYMMNADGTNTTELDLPDKGYLIDPAWSPNGQMVAFSWRRPDGNFDIYVMEPVTRQIIQITRDSGKNERPSWAPDGRHIVFESTRNGERQIWTMLADGTQAHELTMSGHNESPNWSPK